MSDEASEARLERALDRWQSARERRAMELDDEEDRMVDEYRRERSEVQNHWDLSLQWKRERER